jgi:hypothetical protein
MVFCATENEKKSHSAATRTSSHKLRRGGREGERGSRPYVTTVYETRNELPKRRMLESRSSGVEAP